MRAISVSCLTLTGTYLLLCLSMNILVSWYSTLSHYFLSITEFRGTKNNMTKISILMSIFFFFNQKMHENYIDQRSLWFHIWLETNFWKFWTSGYVSQNQRNGKVAAILWLNFLQVQWRHNLKEHRHVSLEQPFAIFQWHLFW